jgi:hypothetical protein
LREPIVVSRIAIERIKAAVIGDKMRNELDFCVQGLRAAAPKGSEAIMDAVYPVSQSICQLNSKTNCYGAEGPVGTPCACQDLGENKIGWRTVEVATVSHDIMQNVDVARDMAGKSLREVFNKTQDERIKDVVRSCFKALNSNEISDGHRELSSSSGDARTAQ